MEEIFKDVKGYEGYYEVSNLGRVRSTSYKGTRILKPSVTKRGYANVIFCVNQVKIHKLVHRLVAEAFLSNPLNLNTVNHKDENKLNNTVDNLEWMTTIDNVRYSEPGTLTEEQVRMIPNLINQNYTQMDIANLFNTSRRTIQFVLQGKHWNHLGIDFTKMRCITEREKKRLLSCR